MNGRLNAHSRWFYTRVKVRPSATVWWHECRRRSAINGGCASFSGMFWSITTQRPPVALTFNLFSYSINLNKMPNLTLHFHKKLKKSTGTLCCVPGKIYSSLFPHNITVVLHLIVFRALRLTCAQVHSTTEKVSRATHTLINRMRFPSCLKTSSFPEWSYFIGKPETCA